MSNSRCSHRLLKSSYPFYQSLMTWSKLFSEKIAKFSRLRRNCTNLALINSTFKKDQETNDKHKNQEKIKFTVLKVCYPWLFSSTKFATAFILIKCGKAQSSNNISLDLFGNTAAPNVLHGFTKSLRDLPNNLHDMATFHSYLGTRTWQSS